MNCGNCLSERAQIVALDKDGICPKCKTDYSDELVKTLSEDAKVRLIAAKLRKQITFAADVLNATERGRAVKADLLKLLDGPISQLDSSGWEAILFLLEAYRTNFTGSVLSVLKGEKIDG